MSLQTRLSALITAVGADIKELKAPHDFCRIRTQANVSVPTGALPQLAVPFTFGASPAISGTPGMWSQGNQWIAISKTGRWLIGFEIVFESKAAEQLRDVVLMGGSSGVLVRLVEDRVSVATGVNPWLKGSDVVDLTNGDYLQLFVSQNSGAAVNVIPVASNASKMYAYYLGPST